MRVHSTVPGLDEAAVRRAIDGCPQADGYTLLVKPMRYRTQPSLSAITVFDDREITLKVPEPFLPFGEIVIYGMKRRNTDPPRFIPLSEGITFRTRAEVIRFLYLHEWYHWWLFSTGERFQRETACDRFALAGWRKREITLEDARQALRRRGEPRTW
jgi:hypothetical protein